MELAVKKETSEAGSEKANNIDHVLNPEKFIRLFTKKRCTNEDKLMQEILRCICALRNSGGGKLTIWLTETCSTREVETCAKIIINAAENALPTTKRTDFIKLKCTNRLLIFSIRGSKEIVTMKYNMYIIENDVVKLVPSIKSAAEVRILLQTQKGKSVRRDETRSKEEPGARAEEWVQVETVKDQTISEQEPSARAEERVQELKMVNDRTTPKKEESPSAKKWVQGKIVKDQTKPKEEPGPTLNELALLGKKVFDLMRKKIEPGLRAKESVQGKIVQDETE